jgi:hypothetical protein
MDGGFDRDAQGAAGGGVCMDATDRAAGRCPVGTLHSGSLHFLHMHAFELIPSDCAAVSLSPPRSRGCARLYLPRLAALVDTRVPLWRCMVCYNLRISEIKSREISPDTSTCRLRVPLVIMESVVDVLCVGDREERTAAVLNFHQAPLDKRLRAVGPTSKTGTVASAGRRVVGASPCLRTRSAAKHTWRATASASNMKTMATRHRTSTPSVYHSSRWSQLEHFNVGR